MAWVDSVSREVIRALGHHHRLAVLMMPFALLCWAIIWWLTAPKLLSTIAALVEKSKFPRQVVAAEKSYRITRQSYYQC